jgi:acyl-ACP thioesterase
MHPQPIWIEKTRVRSFETDFRNRWKPACFFQAMQETATHHAGNLGYDYEDMLKNNQIWLLSRMRILWTDFPYLREEITIQTWPKGIWQKVFFMRDFIFSAEDGRRLATATSAWLLINTQTHRMLMPQSLGGELPLNQGLSALDEYPEKLPSPSASDFESTFFAGYSSVDLMGHVNNARYIEWICDTIPMDWYSTHSLKVLQVNYNNEVKPGDEVQVTLARVSSSEEDWLGQGMNRSSANRAFEIALRWQPCQPT